MLNITTSLASLGQILRANNSKPAVTLPSTPASIRNPTSAASISDQGQAMLAQDAAKIPASSAMQGELPVEMYQIPPWLASVLPMTGGELPKLLNGFGDSHVTLNKSFLYDGKDQERADYTKMFNMHWENILQEHNINTTEDFYQKIIVDKKFGENIHQQLKEVIQGDRQMMGLAAKFNWTAE